MSRTQRRKSVEHIIGRPPLTPPDTDDCTRCNGTLRHKVADVCDGGQGDRLVDAFACINCGAQGHVTRTLGGDVTARIGPAFQLPASKRLDGGHPDE